METKKHATLEIVKNSVFGGFFEIFSTKMFKNEQFSRYNRAFRICSAEDTRRERGTRRECSRFFTAYLLHFSAYPPRHLRSELEKLNLFIIHKYHPIIRKESELRWMRQGDLSLLGGIQIHQMQ